MGDLSKNFSTHEFGGPMSATLIGVLQDVRDAYSKPMAITSGWRTAKHNADIGGVSTSAHIPVDLEDGEGFVSHAVDIACSNGKDRFRLVELFLMFSIVRIGVAKDFIHIDNDSRKPQEVLWVY